MKLFDAPRDTDAVFEQMFEVFPRKRRGTRRMAYPAWKEAIKRESPEIILAGAKAYAESEPGEYGKGLPAWLNGDQWAIEWGPVEKVRDKSVMKARYFDLRTRYKKNAYHDFMQPEEIKEMQELEASL